MLKKRNGGRRGSSRTLAARDRLVPPGGCSCWQGTWAVSLSSLMSGTTLGRVDDDYEQDEADHDESDDDAGDGEPVAAL
jgi:hypothetical protein